MTGLMVAVPIFFVDIEMVTDICSAGTLFAFCLVCGGVIKLRMDKNSPPSTFKTPYVNSRYIVPLLFIASCIFLFADQQTFEQVLKPSSGYAALVNFPTYAFLIGFAIFSVLAAKHQFSLIPSLGLICCFYMLSQIGYRNWLYFGGWLLIGLCIYFVYGRSHSNLARTK